jgi:hypothetical protein
MPLYLCSILRHTRHAAFNVVLDCDTQAYDVLLFFLAVLNATTQTG